MNATRTARTVLAALLVAGLSAAVGLAVPAHSSPLGTTLRADGPQVSATASPSPTATPTAHTDDVTWGQ
ncbi:MULTISPECIES: hypothetical protein [Kitasatospora]|uniref:Uncharacterized protein n=1 Tax=Kitasatospora setae (strain ATCC 33774 / DSM 43861 / JCM 3304 / KCC A-0304 / NBRC 14216 / KM-6054) TaxID=452652 RepID=E4N1M6_KITSK|nr:MULTISPECIES: hypothetical protein [Kitasatospora]BAJ32060.1 hypothetical protein KSE_63020 [Kitasatospora setae KM-6054]